MKKIFSWSVINYVVIGSVAYMAANIVHECLGHSVMCLLLGKKITLISSVYFRCNAANYLTGVGGPISNLIAGTLIYSVLQKMHDLPILSKWLLLNAMAYNLFWFSGTMLDSIINKYGDWSAAANKLNLDSHVTHWLLLLVSVLSYVVFCRMIRRCLDHAFQTSPFSKKQLLLYPYLFAVVTAIGAGLLFAGDRINTAFGGALEMVSSLPLLFISFKPKTSSGAIHQTFRYLYVAGALILFIVFCFTLGIGIHFT